MMQKCLSELEEEASLKFAVFLLSSISVRCEFDLFDVVSSSVPGVDTTQLDRF